MRGRSFNDPDALNFVRRREIVQWLTSKLRASCVTALQACLKPDYVALTSCCGSFPFQNFTHLTMVFLIIFASRSHCKCFLD